MPARYDREYERNYGDYRRPDGGYDRGRYGNARNEIEPYRARRMPQPEYPDRASGYTYRPDDDYGATYASGRDYDRGYGYARNRYGADRGYERDLGRDYGYGREGAVGHYGNRYDADPRYRNYSEPDEHERNWWDRTKDELASWFGDEEAERRRHLDALRNAPFRGRGPRGYRRSDERIKEDVHDRLTDHPYLDAYEIVVAVADGDVTLAGTVGSRYEKRLAEDLSATVSGVNNVQNNLRAREAGSNAVSTTGDNPAATSSSARSAGAAGGTK